MKPGMRIGGAFQDRTAWLVLLFLLLGVLAPTACVLWFMNEAVRSQSDSAKHSVAEAYRGELWLMRDRIDSFWAGRAAALLVAGGTPASNFRRLVAAGVADSVVILSGEGAVVYPNAAPAPPLDLTLAIRPDWMAAEALERQPGRKRDAATAYARIAQSEPDASIAARAAQAQIRCLVQNGDKEPAIQAIQQYFVTAHPDTALSADEQLLALRLMKPGDPRLHPSAQHLAALLSDYERTALSAGHRLFLMDELRAAIPAEDYPAMPTYEAERLASQYLAEESVRAGDRALEKTRIKGVWKLTSANGRVLALYHTPTVVAATRDLFAAQQPSRTVSLDIAPPGDTPAGESILAGPLLPGWRISLALLDTDPSALLARRRMVSYLWIGYLVIAATMLAGLLASQSYRRQLRLARLKTDLVAAVSHELKTPLASMRLLVDSLLDDPKADAQKTRDYLELISKENLRLSRLIENFLTFSRLDRNRQKFDFQTAQPREIVRAALEASGERFQADACQLAVVVGSGLPAIRADEDALVTVLLNLLDNAYKYTAKEKRIELRAFSREGRVVFAVEDNGIGIPPREQKRIFRRFYQVDRRLSRDVGGCGLGLSIVDFIVRAHGGTVEVTSQPGVGSTFCVILPAWEASRKATT
nr:HAMP domain-containing sensor histidine kinase [Bryobacteraceae bacterium]